MSSLKTHFNYNLIWLRRLLSHKFTDIINVLRFDRNPIIICGCGRSGTTLLLSILSAHPNIQGLNHETGIFQYHVQNSRFAKYNNLRKILVKILEQGYKKTAHRWLEKTPRNVRFIEDILYTYNNKVKIIHIIRDGRDVTVSTHPLYGDYYVSIERWISDTREGLNFRNNPSVLTVKYEDLVLKFDSTVKKICTFLEEPFHPNLEEFPVYSDVIKHEAYHSGEVEKINHSSIGKWRNPKFKLRIDQFYQSREAVELLKELGYDTKTD